MAATVERLTQKYGALMRVRDVAHELSVSEWTVYNWTSPARPEAPPFPFIRMSARTVRFKASDVGEFLDGILAGPKKKAPAKPEPPRIRAG